uniref:Uncharacterized protein n=1 Tax=Arundo donax TaxID=35708 RepID=A0A0A8XS21_ARUDO
MQHILHLELDQNHTYIQVMKHLWCGKSRAKKHLNLLNPMDSPPVVRNAPPTSHYAQSIPSPSLLVPSMSMDICACPIFTVEPPSLYSLHERGKACSVRNQLLCRCFVIR